MASELLMEMSEKLSIVLWIQPAAVGVLLAVFIALYKGVLANKNSTIEALKNGLIPEKDAQINLLKTDIARLEKSQSLVLIAEANRKQDEFTKHAENEVNDKQKLRAELKQLKKENTGLKERQPKIDELEVKLKRLIEESKSKEAELEAEINELLKPVAEFDEELNSPKYVEVFSSISTNLPDMPHRVRELIADKLSESAQVPDFDAVAETLKISTQTLRRKLAVEGYSYREIASQSKRDLAIYLLHEGKSIKEVALAIGYTEPSTFYRQFKTWTGVTPAEYMEHQDQCG